MKKIIIFAALIVTSAVAQAQYVVDANNHIGIGTTTPAFDIDIQRATTSSEIWLKTACSTCASVVYVDNNSGTGLGVRLRSYGTAATGTLFNGQINAAGAYGLFSNTGGGNFLIGGSTTNDNVYIGGGTTGITMRVDNSVNRVGIGTGTTALSHDAILWANGNIRTGDPGNGASNMMFGTLQVGTDSQEYLEVAVNGNVYYVLMLPTLP